MLQHSVQQLSHLAPGDGVGGADQIVVAADYALGDQNLCVGEGPGGDLTGVVKG